MVILKLTAALLLSGLGVSNSSATTPAPVSVTSDPIKAVPLRIEQFSPQGNVKGVRQVTARFSLAVVKLGDPRLPDPFLVNCPAAGKGRWADGRNTVTPIEQRTSGRFSRGDVVRIRLDLEAQSDMSWVVVDDPVPAGATVLGSGLGGQSELLPRDETRGGWAWPAFEERRFDAYRAYYRFVPKGRWSTEYTLRLNNPGSFLLPATRVEAMYAPEMFGELPNTTVTVDGESDHH